MNTLVFHSRSWDKGFTWADKRKKLYKLVPSTRFDWQSGVSCLCMKIAQLKNNQEIHQTELFLLFLSEMLKEQCEIQGNGLMWRFWFRIDRRGSRRSSYWLQQVRRIDYADSDLSDTVGAPVTWAHAQSSNAAISCENISHNSNRGPIITCGRCVPATTIPLEVLSRICHTRS